MAEQDSKSTSTESKAAPKSSSDRSKSVDPDSVYPEAPEGGVEEVTPPADDGHRIDEFGELTREELVRMRSFIARALQNKGQEAQPGTEPTTLEKALNTQYAPRDDDGSGAHGLSSKEAAKKADVDEDDVLDYAVHQNSHADGSGYGPKYLVVVKNNGSKEAVEL